MSFLQWNLAFQAGIEGFWQCVSHQKKHLSEEKPSTPIQAETAQMAGKSAAEATNVDLFGAGEWSTWWFSAKVIQCCPVLSNVKWTEVVGGE
jgi:hypothetical protein